MTQITDDIDFVWQAQYLVRLEGDIACSTQWKDVSYVMRIKGAIQFPWQAQYLVRLEGDFTCCAHWK